MTQFCACRLLGLNPDNPLVQYFSEGAALAAIILLYRINFAAKAAPTKGAPHFGFTIRSNGLSGFNAINPVGASSSMKDC